MPRISRPTKIKKLHGEPNKDRINQNEPQPREGIPTCPKHLNTDARREWKRIAPELDAMGIMTHVDRAALAGYCQAYGRWVQAENKIKKLTDALVANKKDAADAYLLKTQAGNVIISPLLSVANRCMEEMHKFLVEFGMTPSSRTRLQVNPQNKEDELDEFLNAGKMN